MKLYTTLGRCRRDEIRSTRNIEEMRAERSTWLWRSWVVMIVPYEWTEGWDVEGEDSDMARVEAVHMQLVTRTSWMVRMPTSGSCAKRMAKERDGYRPICRFIWV